MVNMADNLSQKSHKPSEKSKFNNIVHRTTSESLRLNEEKGGLASLATNLQAGAHNPRKISSFQITSVTVGSRVSVEAADDSADDLDESHTEDNLSRVTDVENETPSFSEDTFSKDDVFYNASSGSLGCAPVIPTSSQYGLAIVNQDTNNPLVTGVPNLNHHDINDMHVSVTSSVAGNIINIIGSQKPQEGMKEIQEHVRNERFKVVKIESTEPFRRGRWTCMDYLDHTASQPTAPIIVNNNLDCGEGANAMPAPDSGVVLTDGHRDDTSVDSVKTITKDLQVNIQTDQNAGVSFPMVSPGQSLTQPVNLMQQQMPQNQTISVQSPPLELAQAQAAAQQHAQSMSHIALNPPVGHPPPSQPQPTQSFPQHQLQQAIAQAQAQGMPQMQQMPVHQQMQPQQMQQLQNQAQMQMQNQQHMGQPQPQLQNLQQMQHMPQMQQIQPQMQQLQLQHMQAQQQHPMQQTQMPIPQHHLTNQTQQQQMQHLSNQPQMHAMQGQAPHQMTNHMQHVQMPQQAPQNQMMPMSSQQMGVQQSYIPQPQANGQPMMQTQPQPMVQQQHSVPQYHQQQSQPTHPGQSLPQDMMANIASSQAASLQNNIQSMAPGSSMPTAMQMNPQQGQNMPQSMQMMSQQPQNMPISMDGNQNNMQMPVPDPMYLQQHIAQAQNILPQQVAPQNQSQQAHLPPQMQYVMPQQTVNNQSQAPVQTMGQQMPQVSMPNVQQTSQPVMQNIVQQPQQGMQQNVVPHPMSMQQNMPVSMQATSVHTVPSNTVQSQPQVSMNLGGAQPNYAQATMAPMPIMTQTNISAPMTMQNAANAQMEHGAAANGTAPQPMMTNASSAATVLPASSSVNYCGSQGVMATNVPDCQNFGSPVNAAASHSANSLVNSNVCVSASEVSASDVSSLADGHAGDVNDGREETQPAGTEDGESVNAVAAPAVATAAAASAVAAAVVAATSVPHSRAQSPQPPAAMAGDIAPTVADQTHHTSASGTSAVAIDNKIEQAMDLVKSHLMFAVREEVEVLKERISELMERIAQLEMENAFLRSHASAETLAHLAAAGGAANAAGERGAAPPQPQPQTQPPQGPTA